MCPYRSRTPKLTVPMRARSSLWVICAAGPLSNNSNNNNNSNNTNNNTNNSRVLHDVSNAG